MSRECSCSSWPRGHSTTGDVVRFADGITRYFCGNHVESAKKRTNMPADEACLQVTSEVCKNEFSLILKSRNYSLKRSKRKKSKSGLGMASLYTMNLSTMESVSLKAWENVDRVMNVYKDARFQEKMRMLSMYVAHPFSHVHHTTPVDVNLKKEEGKFTIRTCSQPETIHLDVRWNIIPVNVYVEGAGTGHAILIVVYDSNIYYFDPNGILIYENESASKKDKTSAADCMATTLAFHYVTSRLFFEKATSRPKNLSGASPFLNFRLKSVPTDFWLLPFEGVSQSDALRFADSDGICGAYVGWVIFLISVNNNATLQDIRTLFRDRMKQWSNPSPKYLEKKLSILYKVHKKYPNKLVHTYRNKGDDKDRTETVFDDDAVKRASSVCLSAEEAEEIKEQVKVPVPPDKYEALQRKVDRLTEYTDLGFKFPPSVLQSCPDGYDKISTPPLRKRVTSVLDRMTINGRATEKAAIRREFLEQGVTLNWLESVLFSYILYIEELDFPH